MRASDVVAAVYGDTIAAADSSLTPIVEGALDHSYCGLVRIKSYLVS